MQDSLSFRPLRREDLCLMQGWLAQPHIAAWWGEEACDIEGVPDKYGPAIDGLEPTRLFIIEHGARPIGWIQWYRWSDYPEHARKLGAEPESAGVDLAIGEAEMIGKGIGPAVIGKFIDEFVFADASITAVLSDPEKANTRSVRAFEKAGFRVIKTVVLAGESCQRCVVRVNSPYHA